MQKSLGILLLAMLFAATTAAQQATDRAGSKPSSGTRAASTSHNNQARAESSARIRTADLTAGEAARLETKEAGLNREEHQAQVDNRGRVTAARHTKKHGTPKAAQKHSVAKAHAGSTARNTNSRQPHSAKFKTGELNSKAARHAQVKQASRSVHAPSEGAKKSGKSAEATDNANQGAHNPPRLKKNNARMF